MKNHASSEKLEALLKKIMSTRFKIDSQEELTSLVLRHLRKEDKSYSVSSLRLKRIALSIPEIGVTAKIKHVPKIKDIDSCPICENKIEPLTVRNLLNKDVKIGYKCSTCNYESTLDAFMPMKYAFVYRKI